MKTIEYHKDSDNIVHIIFNRPDSAVNLMDLGFADDLTEVADKLQSDDFVGVILRSTKSTFFAGGDLAFLSSITDETAGQVYQMSMQMKQAMRVWESCSKPVVACINGSALGGGFELALSCHHRIAVNDSRAKLGLPEVNLGLLPGAGGLTRMVRLLGLEQAMPYLAEGRLLSPEKALAAGLIHQMVENEDLLLDAARNWIKANPQVQQPYDTQGYKMPGGTPSQPQTAQFIALAPAILRKATQGTLPAPEIILSAMVEGAQVDFETALRIESRYFTQLTRTQVAKNLISTFWFGQNEIKAAGLSEDDKNNYVSAVFDAYVAEGSVLSREVSAASIENAAWACGFAKGPLAEVEFFDCNSEKLIALDDIKDRLLFIAALQSVKCLEQGVIDSVAVANIASVQAAGYPKWTGGTLQFIKQYPLAEFIDRANQLAEKYGDRFKVDESLLKTLQTGLFFI